jgi:cell division septation protein DedD
VGAFQQRSNAERLRRQLDARYPVYVEEFAAPAGQMHRVRVGRLATEADAQELAATLARENGLQTFVVRLDGLQ